MSWIKTVDEEQATGTLEQLYEEMKEPWGSVDKDGLGVELESYWDEASHD